MALVGTSAGTIFVLDAYGVTQKQLSCGNTKVMAITSDEDYIAVLAYDGFLTVWLKEGYVKWWQLNTVNKYLDFLITHCL